MPGSDIPNPRHELGYPESQLHEFLDDQKFNRFKLWMRGQTVALIDGESVYYTHDLLRWLRADPIVD